MREGVNISPKTRLRRHPFEQPDPTLLCASPKNNHCTRKGSLPASYPVKALNRPEGQKHHMALVNRKTANPSRGFPKKKKTCFCFLHWAERTNNRCCSSRQLATQLITRLSVRRSTQQQRRQQRQQQQQRVARTYVPVVGSNIKAGSGSVGGCQQSKSTPTYS